MDIRGLTVHELYVEKASDIADEYYAAVIFDRGAKKPMVMLSRMGGMDVEEIAELHDVEAADPQEQRAQEAGLQYVKLDGDVGILGNGAGLVMSTLDVVAQAGGDPANFCDVGGGADAEKISTALDIVTSNEQVKSVLFNIFGGITRGDEVARGLLSAIERTGIDLPIVVRLDGTNAEEGRQILAENTPENVVTEKTMLEAARRAVELARDGGR